MTFVPTMLDLSICFQLSSGFNNLSLFLNFAVGTMTPGDLVALASSS